MILHEERQRFGKQYCDILPLLMGAGAVAGIGGSIFGGIMGNKGAKAANQAITQAENRADNRLSQAWTATAEATQPYRQLGERSSALLGNLLAGGDVGQALQASPLFKFQQEQGTRDLNRQLAARGLYGSGAGLETLARFNAQLQADEGERIMSRLFGATQLGANMANSQAGFYANLGGQQANNITQAGMARAGQAQQGYQSLAQMGQGIGGQLSGLAGGLGSYMMYQPLMQAQASLLGGGMPRPSGGGVGFSLTGGPSMYQYTGYNGLDPMSGARLT